MEDVNNPKDMKNKKILEKVTWTNYEEHDFRGAEDTMVEEEYLIGILGVV